MRTLGERFIDEFGLANQNELTKSIACECLYLVYIQYEHDRTLDARQECYPSDMYDSSDMLLQVLKLAGYWSNDLSDLLRTQLIKEEVKTPLLDDENLFKPIMKWLDKNGYVISRC